ncbi:Carbohydrate-binding module family 20 protein, related [Eimeria brunetti]|uniref:Carbohydrate-binding module family 20 protein, related n=1 Tax=Eimeria brunetti TaxID=51314 RepID=U6LHP5_9EIME|nr:Carbohydrate-binding module family 20 protein, related [Eimeria brunetti]
MAVVFECHCSATVPGQWVAVVGSAPQLGGWEVERSVRLHTTASSFPVWSSAPVPLPAAAAAAAAAAGGGEGGGGAGGAAAAVEFKFIIVGPESWKVIWEPLSSNRLLPVCVGSVCYRGYFGEKKEELLLLQQQDGGAGGAAGGQQRQQQQRGQQQEATWMGRTRESFSSSLKRLSSGLDLSPQSPSSESPLAAAAAAAAAAAGEDSCAHLLGPSASTCASAAGAGAAGAAAAAAAGGDTKAADYLLSPSNALNTIVEGNAAAASWGAKLEIVKKIIQKIGDGSSFSKAPAEKVVAAIDALCYSGVYLQFIKQGLICCSEDGEHHRPNVHANISRELSIHLELLLQGVASRGDDFASVLQIVARDIPSCLPSFAAAYRVSEPLTRIRNIAHRNDIPLELKNEIKKKIQNKIHRCAGPEDLEATRLLLQRMHAAAAAAAATYPPDFLSELETFYKELVSFFNQADLSQRLREIQTTQTLSSRTAATISRFLDAKERSKPSAAAPPKLLLTLGLATDIRFVLLHHLLEIGLCSQEDQHNIQNM